MTAIASDTISIKKPRQRHRLKQFWLGCQRARHQLGLAVQWWMRRHTSYQPVFVLATHRSGSNLLMDYMKRLPGVQCHSEVLCVTLPYGISRSQRKRHIALRHLRRSLHTLSTPVRACKLMLDQLTTCHLSLDALDEAFPRAKYIVLYRQSLAEQYLSHVSAKATDQWYLVDGQQPKQVRVSIDPAELRTYCTSIRQSYRTILDHAWLPQRSVLLSYEELAADPGRHFSEQIGPLLGVPAARPETALRKQNTKPLDQRVANYRQVAALLQSPLCLQHYSFACRQPFRRAA